MDDAEARQLIIDYKHAFSGDHGERVLANLKRMARFDYGTVPVAADGHIDPYEVMRQEGMRSVIIHIETMMKKDLDEEKGITNVR